MGSKPNYWKLIILLSLIFTSTTFAGVGGVGCDVQNSDPYVSICLSKKSDVAGVTLDGNVQVLVKKGHSQNILVKSLILAGTQVRKGKVITKDSNIVINFKHLVHSKQYDLDEAMATYGYEFNMEVMQKLHPLAPNEKYILIVTDKDQLDITVDLQNPKSHRQYPFIFEPTFQIGKINSKNKVTIFGTIGTLRQTVSRET